MKTHYNTKCSMFLKGREKPIITNPDFWDCECTKNYIHPYWDESCPICGVLAEDMPESRVDEVKEYLLTKKKEEL